jgi:phosphate transport system substrate-binding protein
LKRGLFRFTAATLGMLIVGTTLLSLTSCTPISTNQKPAETPQQKTIKITGAGTVYQALQLLATAYEAKVKNTKVIFLPNNQSEGGITGLKNNLVDIGAVTRPLKPQEDNNQINYHEIAKDALLVATHPTVKGVTNLQTKDLKAIYSGAIKNWRDLGGPDAKIIVLDRPEDESAKKLLRQYYLGKDLKTTSKAVILQQEAELITALQDTPYSIGAFSLAYAVTKKLPANRLSLDGVAPTIANLQTDKYQMVRHLGIVFKDSSGETAKGFIDFALSKNGAEELLKFGFVPSTPK